MGGHTAQQAGDVFLCDDRYADRQDGHARIYGSRKGSEMVEIKANPAPIWTSAFVRVTARNFLLFTGFQVLLPTVSPYAADLGAGKTAVGIVVGTMPVLAILVRPFVGVALDRLGRRGPLLFGLAVHGLAMGLYALAPSLGGLTGLIAARALQGIG
ncbi:MFS transporter [Brockia lithotrophica]|uniref:MFS transporter n=1 Tax=Brockia lithotrophica TaxID=933949 RepID=A0A660KYU2_9BACL|nr:MFS transporter [Brockia lithotrophica]